MTSRSPIHDRIRENRVFLGRTLIAVIGVLAMMALLAGRMAYLQVVNHQHFSTLSQQNRVRLVPIAPTRGLIYDRNGVLLAENRPSFRLVVTPEQVKDMDATLAGLAALVELREVEVERFHELRRRQRRFQEIPLKLRLSEDEIARIAVNRHRFPGVEVRAQLSRYYPLGKEAVHAVGYVGRINAEELERLDPANYRATSHIGKTGIERFYEDVLHGTAGVERVETNALGRVIRTLERTPPVPGKDLYLTLDIELQRAAEAALGDYTGAVVAIEPATGEVLAFVSKPGFDPNLFVNGIELDDFRALQSDSDRPLFNRALRGQYPPGSTTKPFVGLAALENGITDQRERVFCPGYYQLPGIDHRYRCWNRHGHGPLTLSEAIVESCDVYFYDLSYRLGIDAMSSFLGQFNFGSPTGVDLPGELSGILPSREWKRRARNEAWYHGETLISAIGQGFSLSTPLQLAHATAVLANRGAQITPHLLRATSENNLENPAPHRPEPRAPIELKNSEHWEHMIEAMRLTVHGRKGTARAISRDITYQMAGKTGTSQVFSIAQDQRYDAEKLARELHNHALFVAFAPLQKPRIAVAVIVEHGGSGSGVAAPVARKVLDAYLAPEAANAE